jgi:eukaryotic-like serine/threonine-protein kinase
MTTAVYSWDQVLRSVRAALAPEYDVIRLIGVGSMAAVYLARHADHERELAVKIMHSALVADPDSVARFEREARAAMLLDHPFIVKVHGARDLGGCRLLEMDYVPGGPLAARTGAPLPLPIVLTWLSQLGSALGCAHAAGVLHRDLNPSNVLLDSAGNAVVTDFGIAAIRSETRLTDAGHAVGTPAYMSPEQLSGDLSTEASDQYALGVVAYELLTGRRPFYGSTTALVEAHLSEIPSPLRIWRPELDEHFADAVARMLEKDPSRRFTSIAECVTALQPTGTRA